jgi:hypothetical protein
MTHGSFGKLGLSVSLYLRCLFFLAGGTFWIFQRRVVISHVLQRLRNHIFCSALAEARGQLVVMGVDILWGKYPDSTRRIACAVRVLSPKYVRVLSPKYVNTHDHQLPSSLS